MRTQRHNKWINNSLIGCNTWMLNVNDFHSDPGLHTAAEWKSFSPVVKLQRGSNYLWTIDLSSFRMLTDQCVWQWVRETAGRSRAHLREANASFVWTVNGPKSSISIKRTQLPSVPHLIIQTAEFWRASTESCISDHRSMYSREWCGLSARSAPLRALPHSN